MSTSASAPQMRPGAPVPTSDPLQGGARRYIRTLQLIRNVAGAGTGSGTTAPFHVTHPTVRLHGALTVGFRPDAGEDATIPGVGSFSVTLDAWAKTDREAGGFPIRGNSIIPGFLGLPQTLPFTYEAITGVDEWRGLVTIGLPNATTLATTGWFYLNMMWEPPPGATNISDAELAKIFQSCRAQVGTVPTVFGG